MIYSLLFNTTHFSFSSNNFFQKSGSVFSMLIVLFIFLLTACKSGTKEAATPLPENETSVTLTEAQYKNAGIIIGSLSDKNVSSTLQVNGKIDVPPQNMVSVSAPLGGYLRNTHLLGGMHVTKGQRIATMEHQQYVTLQQEYLQAQSKLHFATLDYNRQKELNQTQASSDKVMQQAQAEMNNQRIIMQSIAEQLRLINIRPEQVSVANITRSIAIYSPISGFVSQVNVNIGKYVNPSEVLFELVDPRDIHLNIKVFERDLSKLYIGQKLIAYSNAHPDKKYVCEIILINKDVTSQGTTDVHCHFVKYDPALIPGMYMNAVVELDSKMAGTLPEEAIVTFEGKQYVFEQTGPRKFEMKEIHIGNMEEGATAIVNADAWRGRPLVLQGAYALLMKLKNKEE